VQIGDLTAGVGAISIDTADFGAAGLTLIGASVVDAGGGDQLTAGSVTIDASGAVGSSANPLNTATAGLNITAGSIDVANALADPVTVSRLSAAGAIGFSQSGGGSLGLGTVTTTDGAITLANTAGGLTVTGPITADGAGRNIDLRTGSNGNITLTGTTTAAGDRVTINADGAINGAGRVTAGTIDLDAKTGIGAGTALALAAGSISADTANGNIDLDNTLGSAATVISLTTGTGSITFDQAGGGSVDIGTVTSTDGAITPPTPPARSPSPAPSTPTAPGGTSICSTGSWRQHHPHRHHHRRG
jgi:hypothetical protein